MTHSEDYDFSIVGEPILYRTRVTIQPAQDTGMLVLTDSSLYFIRAHNGRTFVSKVVWRSEILSCTATSHLGSSALDLNTSRGALLFTGEASALERIADQLSNQPKADSPSSTCRESSTATSPDTTENAASEPNWSTAGSVYRPPAKDSPVFKLTDEVKQIGLGFLLLIAGVAIVIFIVAPSCNGEDTRTVVERIVETVEVEKVVEREVVQTVEVEREVVVEVEKMVEVEVIQTVEVEREVVVEVEKLVIQTVVVEKVVEVVKEVEVEVVKEIEVVKEVEKEVQVVVTATPSSTPTPTSSPTLGPSNTPTPTATPSPTPEPPSTPAELVERVQDSVVRVQARSGGTFFGTASQGSGFIFAVEGTTAFVATNQHIIDGSNSVEVQIEDSTYDALVLGWDAKRDVAVVSICCSPDFIALPWGDASPSEGESVIAIGYPNSDTGNLIATIGEVRAPDDLSIEHDFIPHSAPLNPGNSGGPLFSMPGAEVVGINTAGGTETLAFYAVPYQAIAQQVADWRSQLIVDATATPTPTTTKPANTLFRVKLNGVIYTIHSVIDPAPERSSLTPGERAVAIDVSIEAVDNGSDYDEDDFVVQDSDGYIYEPDWLNRGVKPDLGSGTLAAGQRVRGWVNFNVPGQARISVVQLETGYGSPRVVIADLTKE